MSSPTANGAKTGYLPEVQGLRTVALGLVAVFHVWFGRVSGGVDVFFVVSAYLMTRSLAARAEAGRITRPVEHLLGKFARLLPAAAAAIVLILLAVCLLEPVPLWEQHLEAARASLLYVENRELQLASADYLDPGPAGPSPFQHFWSLSVQGQAFVVWALLHCLGDLAARVLGLPVRRVLLGVFALIGALSFGYALHLVAVDQSFAYFDTAARLWEFAAGSLLALAQHRLRLPAALRAGCGWLGLLAILACGFALPVESSFPGWAALWPVLASLLVILAAAAPGAPPTGAGRLLAHPLLAAAGRYTYALYLLHWPVLVLSLSALGIDRADWLLGTAVLVVSALLSVLLARGVEQPVLRWLRRTRHDAATGRGGGRRGAAGLRGMLRAFLRRNRRPGIAVLLLLAMGFGAVGAAGGIGQARLDGVRAEYAALDIPSLGANAAGGAASADPPAELLDYVRKDTSVPGERCAEGAPHAAELCFDLPPLDGAEPDRTILALGNSHSIQFNGALLEAVERQPTWALHTRGAWSCTIETAQERGGACVELWPTALDWIEEHRPDAVVLFGTQSTLTQELSQWGLLEWIEEARERSPGTEFVAVRDNPRFDRDPAACAGEFGPFASGCLEAPVDALDPEFVAALEAAGVIWVDLQDAICPDGVCAPAQGGLWVFQDDNHLTDTYARSLAQRFAEQVHPRLEWWPEEVYSSGELVDRSPPGDILEHTEED
ncbi:acyltransferase family protein [Gulosibacter sp. 10]|uniref:acyltransferase family protein n=1 Tax=Gulosibacter sp. 10 TaxID=1255570 RepID=UPI00097ED8C1|nr:acyltransferase family protein [Gulosibacter sp. 10]SJM66194.1 acyltransferase 3 [Gulosibacter sp. 10]